MTEPIKPGKKIPILFVESDKDMRAYFTSVFSSNVSSFDCNVTDDPLQGIEMLIKKNYDCLILDYALRFQKGQDIMKKLEKHGLIVPVIIMSDSENELIAVSAIKEGAYDYIPKRLAREKEYYGTLVKSILNSMNLHRRSIEGTRAMRSLEMREERYRNIVENSPIFILRFSPEDRMISFVNDGFCGYFMKSRYEVLGENFYDIIPDDLTERITSVIGSLNPENQIATFENYLTISNVKRWQLWNIQILCDEENNVLEYQCMGEDITSLKTAQIELQNQKKYLQAILDSQDNMIIVSDKEEILMANIKFLNFFGHYNLGNLKIVNRDITGLACSLEGYEVNQDHPAWIEGILNDADKHNFIAFKPYNSEEPRIFSAFASKLLTDDERYVISFTDVTELEMKSKGFEVKASLDVLTSIYNRRKFEEILLNELIKVQAGQDMSVIFFDIDHFKKVNDVYGHEAGDSVLRELPMFVKQCIRNSDIFARWGGEEFVILLPGANLTIALDIARKVRHKVAGSTFKTAGKVTCSFGVAQARVTENSETLFKRVDRALYKAKEAGRDRVVLSSN